MVVPKPSRNRAPRTVEHLDGLRNLHLRPAPHCNDLLAVNEHHAVWNGLFRWTDVRSEEHTSELQSHSDLVCRLLLEKKNNNTKRGKPEPCDPRQQEPYDQYHENSHVKHSDYHKMALLSRQPT